MLKIINYQFSIYNKFSMTQFSMFENLEIDHYLKIDH